MMASSFMSCPPWRVASHSSIRIPASGLQVLLAGRGGPLRQLCLNSFLMVSFYGRQILSSPARRTGPAAISSSDSRQGNLPSDLAISISELGCAKCALAKPEDVARTDRRAGIFKEEFRRSAFRPDSIFGRSLSHLWLLAAPRAGTRPLFLPVDRFIASRARTNCRLQWASHLEAIGVKIRIAQKKLLG